MRSKGGGMGGMGMGGGMGGMGGGMMGGMGMGGGFMAGMGGGGAIDEDDPVQVIKEIARLQALDKSEATLALRKRSRNRPSWNLSTKPRSRTS